MPYRIRSHVSEGSGVFGTREDTPSSVIPTIEIGPFPISDVTTDDLVDLIVQDATGRAIDQPAVVYALHVGGLNEYQNLDYINAIRAGDLVYADGMAVVALARIAGAKHIQRAPTTDLGWKVIEELQKDKGRPIRLAIVGGPEGLAQRAGLEIQRRLGSEIVFTTHGYHDEWSAVLDQLSRQDFDLLLIGMGMPTEALWCRQHAKSLPPAVVMTCGGWLGFIVGDERRAPRWMRTAGLEWVFRLMLAPKRLGNRYARGLATCLKLLVPALTQRYRSR